MGTRDSSRSRRERGTPASEQVPRPGSPAERLRQLGALARAGSADSRRASAEDERVIEGVVDGDDEFDDLMRPGWTPSEGRHREGPAPARRTVPWRVIVIAAVLLLGLSGLWVARAFTARSSTVPERSTSIPVVTMSPTGTSTGAAQLAGSTSGVGAGAATTAASVLVHVVGAVASPGVVTLTPGARVTDAVRAAGGALPQADLGGVNLARQVADGEQIVIPTPGQTVTTAAPGPSGATAGASGEKGSTAGGSGGTPIDLNKATAADLDALPGIGPVLAGRIVEWRAQNGPFTSVDELGEVSGIGDKLLDRLREQVKV